MYYVNKQNYCTNFTLIQTPMKRNQYLYNSYISNTYITLQETILEKINLFLLSQAELVAVEGKEIETHYVLARERIRRWNSTSKCYLLVENLPTPLQV